MDGVYRHILSPIGEPAQDTQPYSTRGVAAAAGKPVIGLLNNSKPNVSYFLEALADEVRRSGRYDVVTASKARSAEPYAGLTALADQCDYVINAVAD